jgi:hypothetical protein
MNDSTSVQLTRSCESPAQHERPGGQCGVARKKGARRFALRARVSWIEDQSNAGWAAQAVGTLPPTDCLRCRRGKDRAPGQEYVSPISQG